MRVVVALRVATASLSLGLCASFGPVAIQKARLSRADVPFSDGSPLALSNESADETQQAESKDVSSSGTFYDDEVEPAPKIGISDSMRDRLMQEASTGLDSETKQNNVLLYIIVGVAGLVILGGAGIFY